MIIVENFNTDTGVATLMSDKEDLSGQISELTQQGASDVAMKYAVEHGIIFEGYRETGARALQFYDAKTDRLLGAEVNSEKYAKQPELVKVRKIVKLALPRQPLSTLAQMNMK